MPQTATTHPVTPPAAPPVAENLCAALEKYHEDADLESLKRTYENYLQRKEKLARPDLSLSKALSRGFRSFRFRPAASLDEEVVALQKRAGVYASKNYFETAGEYLSLGIIRHILETEESNG